MKRLIRPLAGMLLLAVFATAHSQMLIKRFVAGQDYHVVADAPPPGGHGPVHVAEFFLYTCPHCYHFEPALEKWLAAHPNIDFERVPVLFGDGGLSYARLYYTEQALGVTDKLHDAIFDAIHQQGRPLATEQAQRAFFVAHGISAKRFNAAYNSDKVDHEVQAVGARMRHFGVVGVPSMSVGKRFWVSGETAGSNKRMLKVVDYLIEQARERSGSGGQG